MHAKLPIAVVAGHAEAQAGLLPAFAEAVATLDGAFEPAGRSVEAARLGAVLAFDARDLAVGSTHGSFSDDLAVPEGGHAGRLVGFGGARHEGSRGEQQEAREESGRGAPSQRRRGTGRGCSDHAPMLLNGVVLRHHPSVGSRQNERVTLARVGDTDPACGDVASGP
jgi:hypothetical protein